MLSAVHTFGKSSRWLTGITLAVVLLISCSPTVERPVGPAGAYADAKDMFKRGRFGKALEFTDGLATASPPTQFTERALVLRVVIYTGQLDSSKELAEAYATGADKTADSHVKADFGRLRHDILQEGGKAALGLAETAQRLVPDGVIAKELTLEASFPTTEGPSEVKDLERVAGGGSIEPDQQADVAADSLRKGIDDALAEVVMGDRAKARSALATGSTKLNGLDFAFFLGKGLAEGAIMFDRKHLQDGQKAQALCTEGDNVMKAALALLKDNPDKDKENQVKKQQDQYKTIRKSLEHYVYQ